MNIVIIKEISFVSELPGTHEEGVELENKRWFDLFCTSSVSTYLLNVEMRTIPPLSNPSW